jgi:REP element-mobilizing transposase RayT
MPRRPRFDLPGTIHHVSIRGVEGRRIFVDDVDPADMVERLERWISETGSRCHAWSFNGNHAHLVIGRGAAPLAELMARFTSAFAQRFNWRHERAGHLFMGRYESRRIRGEHDLRWTTLYAAANPVKHGTRTPAALELEPWSSWGGMVGARAPRGFESLECSLALYGDSPASAAANLRAALQRAVETRWARPPDPRLLRLVDDACRRHGIAREWFRGTFRQARAAQAEVLHRALAELEMTRREVRDEIGVSRSRVARVSRVRVPAQPR